MKYILQTRNLTKRYGNKTVVNDLNMNINKGDIYGFLGQNGAGKTTTLRMIMGLIQSTAGEIEVFGSKLDQKDQNKIMERIGVIIEYPGFYLNLTAEENLEIHRRLMGMGNKESIEEALAIVGLLEAKDQKVKGYSLGMKQRLGIARAILHHPEFLVLDEPLNGLDPVGIKEIRQLFLDLSKQGITILISSHLLSEIEQIATRIGIIHHGNLLEEVDYEMLQKKSRHYLEINVNDEQKTVFILEQKLGITDYLIAEQGTVYLYENIDQPALINATLTSNGIEVQGILLSRDRLEDYFLKVTGGGSHA